MTPLKIKNKVGHTSSTILNSCSFQRYRLPFRNLYSILLTQALRSFQKNLNNEYIPTPCMLDVMEQSVQYGTVI